MGKEVAEAFGRRDAAPDEWLVCVRVMKVVARSGHLRLRNCTQNEPFSL